MSLPNPSMTFTPFDPLLSAEMNDLSENVDALAAGTGINSLALTGDKFANNSVTFSKLVSKTWEELGRGTLASPASSISLTGLTARKYLKIIYFAIGSGGTVTNVQIRFNNDSANNYARRTSTDGAADATAINSSIFLNTTGMINGSPNFGVLDVINISNQEKIGIARIATVNGAGAGTAPNRNETSTKWINTSAQITRVDLIASANSFATNSTLIVLGHD